MGESRAVSWLRIDDQVIDLAGDPLTWCPSLRCAVASCAGRANHPHKRINVQGMGPMMSIHRSSEVWMRADLLSILRALMLATAIATLAAAEVQP